MKVVRINRMMLGVSVPVAAFCDRVFGAACVDVDDANDTDGADVLIVGRQRLRDTGIYSFAHDVIPRCLLVHVPPLVVAVIPDRFHPLRYARDSAAWLAAVAVGAAVVVLELGVLRDERDAGASDDDLAAAAKNTQRLAAEKKTPLAWLTGVPLR